MWLFDLQKAIYNAIKVPAITSKAGIYDYIPEETGMPYVVIGDDRAAAFNTKTGKGYETTSQITVWAKARGMSLVKDLLGTLCELLAKNLGIFEFHEVSLVSAERVEAEYVKGSMEVKYRVYEEEE